VRLAGPRDAVAVSESSAAQQCRVVADTDAAAAAATAADSRLLLMFSAVISACTQLRPASLIPPTCRPTRTLKTPPKHRCAAAVQTDTPGSGV